MWLYVDSWREPQTKTWWKKNLSPKIPKNLKICFFDKSKGQRVLTKNVVITHTARIIMILINFIHSSSYTRQVQIPIHIHKDVRMNVHCLVKLLPLATIIWPLPQRLRSPICLVLIISPHPLISQLLQLLLSKSHIICLLQQRSKQISSHRNIQ